MKISILFWLRASAKNSKGYAPLLVRLTLPNNDIANFSTGMKCDINLWNPVKKTASGKGEESKRFNLYISRSLVKLNDIYDDLIREERCISTEVIKNIFLGKAQQRLTLLGCINDHNEKFREKIAITGEGCESTVLKFINLSNKLVSFLSLKYNRKDYFVSEINYSFIQDFRNWLLLYGKNGDPMAADSATGNMKRLKKVLDNLFKRGLMKNDPFIYTKLRWEAPSAIGLNETELKKFERIKLNNIRLQMAKDRFIVSCYSGLSHEDLSRCRREDLVKNFGSDENWIKIYRKKTGQFCKIPVLLPVQEIIDKYWYDPKCIADNRLFPLISLQGMNRYLKILGDLAGIEKSLSSHFGRHCFSMMALNMGVSLQVISEILGHSSVSQTSSVYARTSHALVSQEMKLFSKRRFPSVPPEVIAPI